jgi:hypothetical protein
MQLFFNYVEPIVTLDGPFPFNCPPNCNCDDRFASDQYELIEARITGYLRHLGYYLEDQKVLTSKESEALASLYELPDFLCDNRLDLSQHDLLIA